MNLRVFLLALAIALARGQKVPLLKLMHVVNVNTTTTNTGVKGVSSHIVGGTAVNLGTIPWQVGLYITKPYNATRNATYLCGGSLIHEQWVLTAAHCAINSIIIQVTLGSLSSNSGGTMIQSSFIKSHPNYNPTSLANDVALIKLETPITPNANIKPIKLASTSTVVSTLTVSGWGRTCTTCPSSPTLLYAVVKAITNSKCSMYYGTNSITTNTICTVAQTTTANQSICFGDSGGPLVQTGPTPLLVGVVSFVSGAPNGCNNGGVAPCGYMRAAKFCAWIKTFITGFIC